MTLGLLDRRSREVTWRVWSSVHRTSSVNSTEHSGQKSSQVQSCRIQISSDTDSFYEHFTLEGVEQSNWYFCTSSSPLLMVLHLRVTGLHHWWLIWQYTYSWILHFVHNVITCERYETWRHSKHESCYSSLHKYQTSVVVLQQYAKLLSNTVIHTNPVCNELIMQYWWIGIDLDPVNGCK